MTGARHEAQVLRHAVELRRRIGAGERNPVPTLLHGKWEEKG